MRQLFLLPCLGLPFVLAAQSTPPPAHVEDVAPRLVVFTNAVVHTDPYTTIAKGSLVAKDGIVIEVGEDVKVPAGAMVRDLRGAHIWPSLIEPYSDLGLPAGSADDRKAELEAARHWNGALRADARAHVLLRKDEERADELRKAGFGMVYTHRMDGIARGTSAALLLDDEDLRRSVIQPDLAAHFSFRKGTSPDSYPNSQMGAIALLRQTFLDAQWASGQVRPGQTDAVLQDIAMQLKGRIVVEASDRNEALRWARILEEFKLPAIVKGAGDEYARLDQIKAMSVPMLVPVALPVSYDVQDPFDALEVSFARLKHWEFAPFNAAMLDSVQVPFAFTTNGRKDMKEFWRDMRRIVLCGLDPSRAIAAFTTDPARFFGLDDRIGRLEPGMLANLLITTDHLLAEENKIMENWVKGKRFVYTDADRIKMTGTYDLNLGGTSMQMDVVEKAKDVEAFVRKPGEPDSLKVKASLSRTGTIVSLSFPAREDPSAITRLSGSIHRDGGLWEGQGQRQGGSWFAWSAIRKAERARNGSNGAAIRQEKLYPIRGALHHPLTGSGWIEPPQQATTIFRNATVWTNGPKGIMRNTDVLIHQGKIHSIGERLDPQAIFPGRNKPQVTEVDATGMYLTAGIVDEHSHIAISRGVNESGHMITSEVRIADVIDPDDVNIYRALAGGVTTVQLLHGSANPVGGQSALVKLRWGMPADSMLITDAPKHIKFALGENVTQSNSSGSTRFPHSRMGVEQLYYDVFHRARDHDAAWRAWNALRPREREQTPSPRRDLRLEALSEVLRGDRFITCHSYVQSEIEMFMNVADSMGFKVNTFTHVLEGYKMAGKMREHGVSASTFSDWWAYKLEVAEAIPYNAALMMMNGVHTGINSDDAEMCRRLNQEAAKTVKYGGVPDQDAWKMITLNPARMLKLDHRIGSIEVGKDADLVLWSADPLSIKAKVQRTYVDGICYYDVKKDEEMRALIAQERDRLIRAMLAANAEGGSPRKPERDVDQLWHCDDIGEGHEHLLEP